MNMKKTLTIFTLTFGFVAIGILYYGSSNYKNIAEEQEKLIIQNAEEIAEYENIKNRYEELKLNFSFIASISPLRNIMSPDEISTLLKEVPHGNIFETPFIVSAEYGISIGYHGHPRTDHRGIDIYPVNPEEMKWDITAFSSGFVEGFGENYVYGKYVIIRHSERVRSFYGHLAKIYYSGTTGREVNENTVIGILGDTGISDGCHCHFEVQVWDGDNWISIDPFMFLINK